MDIRKKISYRVFSLNHKTKFYFENGDIHLHKKITCHIVVYCQGPDEIQFNGLKTQRLLKPFTGLSEALQFMCHMLFSVYKVH